MTDVMKMVCGRCDDASSKGVASHVLEQPTSRTDTDYIAKLVEQDVSQIS